MKQRNTVTVTYGGKAIQTTPETMRRLAEIIQGKRCAVCFSKATDLKSGICGRCREMDKIQGGG